MANNELGKDSLHRRNSSTSFDIHEEQGRKISLSQMEAFLVSSTTLSNAQYPHQVE